jgi:fatty-acyl-CoA synthase
MEIKSFKIQTLENYNFNKNYNWLHIISNNNIVRYSYSDLIKRIYDYCTIFKANNLKESDTVLIILKESLDLYAGFFAGIIYGAMPAYFAYPSPKQSKDMFLKSIDNLIQYNEIKLIISYDEIIELLKSDKSVLKENDVHFINFKLVEQKHSDKLEEFDIPKREAFLQFSSGTTGAKKGVKISCEALINQIDAYSEFVKYDEKSVVVSWLPHYHDMGLIACMLMPFLYKIPIYMMSPFEWVMNPKLLFEAITKYKGTHIWLPNFALGHLAKSISEEEKKHFDLSSLEQLIICSEPALYETVTKFTKKFSPIGFKEEVLYDCYAMAENTFAMTSTKQGPVKFLEIDQLEFQKNTVLEKWGGKKIASAGILLPNINIIIRDNDGNDLGQEKIGEVTLKSNCMLDCYHNNPEETEKAFVDGYFKTGDLGFLYKNELYITGRKKDLIIVGGENIYPQDIELILNEEEYLIPGRNVVFGVEDEKVGTEEIVILAEVKEGKADTDVTSLRGKIFNTLNISISDIMLLPHMTLRKGTAGKISRYLNKNEYLSGAFNKYIIEKVSDDDGKELRQIILDIIPGSSKPRINSNTPLLNSGLINSFMFVELLLRIEEFYKIKFPQSMVKPDNFQTIESIRTVIQQLKEKKDLKQKEEKSGSFFKRFLNFVKESE